MTLPGDEARQRIEHALDAALSPVTRYNYQAQWKNWESYDAENGYPSFPAQSVHIADWITQRAANGRKPGTMRMGLSAVSATHRQVTATDPVDDEGVRTAMRGPTRQVSRAQKQAIGLTATSLAAVRSTACTPRVGRAAPWESRSTTMARGLADIALISLMRDRMLRLSEAAAITSRDIASEEDGTGRLTS